MRLPVLLSLLLTIPALASCPHQARVPVGKTITFVLPESAASAQWHVADLSTPILGLVIEEHVGKSFYGTYEGLARGLTEVGLEYVAFEGVVDRTCYTVEVY